MPNDDSPPPRTFYTVELTIAADPTRGGRVTLRAACHGPGAVSLVLPARADQIEWFEPDARMLPLATPRVMWTAWRTDREELAGAAHPTTAQRASAHVTLSPGGVEQAEVDLGAALDALYGPGAFAHGWCVRAWLVGGNHPLPSNIVCWPHPP